MDESRLVNTPFAVGSMTERCCPEAIGLSVLVLVTPTLTLSSWNTLSSKAGVDPLQHLFFLVRGDEDPSFPVRVRLRKLPGLVFGYELVSLAKHTLATRAYLRRIGPIVPGCGLQLFGPLAPSHLSEYSWRLGDLGTTNDAQRKPASFWNHREQEKQEILGHRGLPPASA
ncbi:hypothetical protein IG631_17691 [Alternaria alternata]|nr:hypothetical protein IG631_17691 [Alternaria alternata]